MLLLHWGETESFVPELQVDPLYQSQMVQHWWNHNLKGKNKSTERKNMPQCHFIYHKLHVECPGNEPELLQGEGSC